MYKKNDLLQKLATLMLQADPNDHANTLGIDLVEFEKGRAVMKLDYHHALIGSPDTVGISGGAITALLDMCSGFCATTVLDPIGLTPTIDLRIDYLRTPKPNRTIYAEVEVVRTTEHVIFTRGVAWQDKEHPLVLSSGNFMNMPLETNFEQLLSNFFDSTKLPEKKTYRDEISPISKQLCLEVLTQARAKNDANILTNFIPYTRLLQMQRVKTAIENKWLYYMPPSRSLIGNPTLPAIHGGAIAGFMESAAMMHLLMKTTGENIPKVIDLNIDYIRAGLLKDTYAQCKIKRFGSKLIFMEVQAWQDDETRPIAKARLQVLYT